MRIAVNAIFLQKGQMEGYGWFVQEVFSRLAIKYPEHEFLLVFDRPYDDSFVFAPNCTPIVVGPPARHPASFFIGTILRRLQHLANTNRMSGSILMDFAALVLAYHKF